MKRLIIIILIMGVAIIFFSCEENNSTAPELMKGDQDIVSLDKKPAPYLVGDAIMNFTFTPPTFWNGTITFGDVTYGITCISYDPPRDYSQASPFYEDFYIYELGTIFDLTNPTNVYMKGWEAGVVTYANKDPEPVKFHANGKIEEAYGPFEGWQGRNVHIKGLVYWVEVGLPAYAASKFRIN